MSFTNVDPGDMPPVDDREKVGAIMQATMVELIDLHLIGKHLHWNMVGENFVSTHRMVDEFISDWYDSADEVAERGIQLGFSVDGQAECVAKLGGEIPVGQVFDVDAIRLLVDRLVKLSGAIRTRIAQLDDLISQNILIGVVQTFEKQLWFLRAHLIDEDGDMDGDGVEDEDDEEEEPAPDDETGETDEAPASETKSAEKPAELRTVTPRQVPRPRWALQ